jgi:hypothetical protein
MKLAGSGLKANKTANKNLPSSGTNHPPATFNHFLIP